MKLQQKLKFFIPFALIFLVPFICFSFLLHHYFIVKSQEQLENSVEAIALDAEDDLLNFITRLHRLTSSIGTNPKLTRFYVNNRAILNETSETLKQYTNIDTSIDEMILYYPNNTNQYYSSQGFYSESSLLNQKLKLSDTNAKKARQLFNSENTGLFMLEDANIPQLLLLSNIDNLNYRNGKIIYLFNPLRFADIVKKRNNYDFVVLNHEHQLLYTSKSIDDTILMQLINHNTMLNFKNKSSENDLFVSTETLGLPFKIILLVDETAFFSSINRLKFLFYFGLFSLFIMGLMISWYFSNKQYKPVKNITDNLNAILPNKKHLQINHAVHQDIYHNLQQNIDLIIENQYELSYQVNNQKSQYINTLYKYILEGHQLDSIDLQIIESTLKPFLKSQYFTILIQSDALLDQLDEIFPLSDKNFELYLVNGRFIKQYQLIFAHFNPSSISYIDICHKLKDYLEQENSMETTLFIGRIGNSIMNFYDSYLDTLYLMEQTKENHSIIFFEKTQSNHQTDIHYIFSTNFIKLRNAIENGNASNCQSTIIEIIDIAKMPSTNPIMAKSLLYEIVNCLMKYISEYSITIPSEIYENLSTNFNPYNSQEILLQFGNYLCNEMLIILKNKETNKNNDIINYILANYRRPEFSIDYVAEAIGITVNNINQILKEHTGVTFSKYVQQLRFNYVKEQLTSTDETIKNIINNSGYLDASNFTRQFKNIYGCTPGQYRKNYQKIN